MRAVFLNHSHKIAWGLLLALPAILPFIRRAGPVVLVLAACLTLVPILMRGELGSLLRRTLTPTTMLVAAFLAWAFVTLLWTPVPTRGFHAVVSAGLMVLCGLVLIYGLPRLDHALMVNWLALSIALGASIIAIDLYIGGYLLELIHSRPEPYRYNMVIVMLVLLSSVLLVRSSQKGLVAKPTAFLAILIALLLGESESAKLGFFALSLAVIATSFTPVWILQRVSIVLCILMWIAFPITSELWTRIVQNAPQSLTVSGHASERILIWSAFEKMALAGLPWGWGVESTSKASNTTFYVDAGDKIKYGLRWMHPHNNVLQVAAETGIFGILLAIILTLLAVCWAYREKMMRVARIGFLAGFFSIALVSHGAWQTWWWSVAVLGIIFLRSEETRPI
jgi:O-antigen ligase